MTKAELRARNAAKGIRLESPPAPVAAPPVAVPLPCVWARELTGREREAAGKDHRKRWNWCDHPQDGRGKMNGRRGLPLAEKIVCPCAGCGPTCHGYEAEAPAAVRLTVSADGIGDHLVGLSLAAAWKRDNPEGKLWLDGKKWCRPWLELFADCYDHYGPNPAAHPLHDLARRGDRHYVEAASAAGPRALPRLRPLSAAALAWAAPHRGAVVLCPRAQHGVRDWLRSHWLALETLLAAAGYRTVVVGAAGDRAHLAGYRGAVYCGEPPERVAALLRGAACVVANESGMAHLAGALNVPVVVLAAQLDAKAIHGFWPKSVQLRGPLGCSGCRWTGPHFRPACQSLCASLQAIAPEHVRDTILGAAGRPPTVADVLEIVAAKLGGVPTQWGAADRDRTLGWLFREMGGRFPDGPRVVETGCVRERDDWGAGYFGWLCGMWLEAVGAGELVSVDIDPAHVATARELCRNWTRAAVVRSCSAAYLEARTEPIDVAYLDSMDTYVAGHDAHGLREARAAARLMAPNGLILFDDSPPDGAGGWRGKGRTAIPWLLANGWRVLPVSGYQTVLERVP